MKTGRLTLEERKNLVDNILSSSEGMPIPNDVNREDWNLKVDASRLFPL